MKVLVRAGENALDQVCFEEPQDLIDFPQFSLFGQIYLTQRIELLVSETRFSLHHIPNGTCSSGLFYIVTFSRSVKCSEFSLFR